MNQVNNWVMNLRLRALMLLSKETPSPLSRLNVQLFFLVEPSVLLGEQFVLQEELKAQSWACSIEL